MTVRKYRSIEEMPDSEPREPLDPENLRIAFELSELAYRLHPWPLERGVKKLRSIEEMSRYKEKQLRKAAGIRRPPDASSE